MVSAVHRNEALRTPPYMDSLIKGVGSKLIGLTHIKGLILLYHKTLGKCAKISNYFSAFSLPALASFSFCFTLVLMDNSRSCLSSTALGANVIISDAL